MPQYIKDDPLYGEFIAACENCGWVRKFKQSLSCGLKVGDPLFQTSEDPKFDRCNLCKRPAMKVKEIPYFKKVTESEGFHKIPTK